MRFERLLIEMGLLSPSLQDWERRGSVWFFGSIAAGILLLAIIIVDEVFLDRLLNPALRVVSLLILLSILASIGYLIIRTRRLGPRIPGEFDWRKWLALAVLLVVAATNVFNLLRGFQ